MQVIATAGHVDHGKSALVRALTGMEPDRWAEERRRGLTIDLGFAWMKLPGGEHLAFVDVPGHERFVPNMLAGVGPVPAVLIVVAADGGWMPQSAEHLAAIDAMGIRHGLLVVTRCDLADPDPATRQGLAEIAASSLGRVESVATSSVTGAGLPELRDALARLMAALPPPDAAAPVRLWVDRSFSIRGSGTVVTGTLPAGTVRTGQELLLTPSMRPARIRRIESMNESAASITGVARVALNLRGLPADVPARGMALVDADRWTMTRLADVRLSLPAELRQAAELRLPPDMALHIGSARTAARIRLLGAAGPGYAIVRLMLPEPLPLHVGDRILLRDPGSAGVTILGATVLDVAPPALARRGAAAAAGRELAAWPEVPAVADLLRRHGLLRASAVAAMGTAGCAGDGLRMALSVSAALANMSEGWWMPALHIPGEELDGASYYRPLHSRPLERAAPRARRRGRRARPARSAGHRHDAGGGPRRAAAAGPSPGRGPGRGACRAWRPGPGPAACRARRPGPRPAVRRLPRDQRRAGRAASA